MHKKFMSKHHFKFKEVFMFGWSKTCQHAWFIFLTFLIIGIISKAVTPNLPGGPSMGGFLALSFGVVVTLMMVLSVYSISLMIARNHHFTFADLINPLLSQRRVLKFFALIGLLLLPVLLLSFSAAVLTIGARQGSPSVAIFGMILSVATLIPTIFISVRFKFFPFVVVEHEHSTMKDLIQMSYKLTEGYFWPIFGFLCLAGLLNIAGLIFFRIGLLATLPTTIFAFAHLYDKLKNHEA
jgi:hypothetical protein